jgi:MFS family permease
MVIAPLAGLVAPRVGTRTLIIAGLALQAVAMVWLATTMSADTPYLAMLTPFIFAGVGMGLVFAPLSTAVLATMTSADNAKASGTNSTLREVGVALGIAVLTAVFVGAGGQLTPELYVDAAIPAVLVGAGALALSTVLAVALPAGRASRVDRGSAPSI